MNGKPLVSYTDAKAPKQPKPVIRVKTRNAESGGHLFPDLVNEPLRVFLRGLKCILAGAVDRDGHAHVCKGQVVVCHLKTRGSGGPDDDNTFPGCLWGAHQDQEGNTKEFEYRWVHQAGGLLLRLKQLCRKYTAEFYRAYPHLKKKATT